MIRSFVFSKGKLLNENLPLDVLRMMLVEEDAQIWVDVEQPSAEEARSLLEGVFNFHPLAIEDCIAVSLRPKADDYEQYLFLAMHAANYSAGEFHPSELNLFIGKNFLVTYHDQPLRSVTATVDLVKRNTQTVARAPDRLTYTLLDYFLDEYKPGLDSFALEIDALEQRALQNPKPDFLNGVLHYKGAVQQLRQIISPQCEVLTRIGHREFRIIRAHMLPYYRDLLDRLVRFNDQAAAHQDSLNNTLQAYLSMQQAQVNHVIKVLTVLATLTLPIVGVTSFYGMNLNHFPRMGPTGWPWPLAYGWVVGLTILLTLLIYWILRRKKWL
jgi:magnesium transporter